MSPQLTEIYKELKDEFKFWDQQFAILGDCPSFTILEIMYEDYELMVSLFKAAKSAGLDAAQVDKCYGKISEVYTALATLQKLSAAERPWDKRAHQVVAHLHGARDEAVHRDPPLQVPAPDPALPAEVAAEDVHPAPALPSVEVEIPGSTDEEIRPLPDPEQGDNSSPLPPLATSHQNAKRKVDDETTLPPAMYTADGVVAPKYLVSGAASKPPETIKKFSKDEKTLPPAMYTADGVVAPKYFVSGAASKPPETIQRLSKDEIPAFKGSDGLLLMQFNAAMYNVANDDPHGTQVKPILAAQVIYWVLTDTEELPAACTWIFPATGIGVLQFAASATDKAKQEVKSGINHYLLTRTFPKGIRGDYETAEQEQMFNNTVGDQHNAEPTFRKADLYYSEVTHFKAKLEEYFGNRKKKKVFNSMKILRRSKVSKMMIQMKRKLSTKLMKQMNRKIILMKRSRFIQKPSVPSASRLGPGNVTLYADCKLRLCSGINMKLKIQMQKDHMFFYLE